MVYCWNCGEHSDQDAQFCSQCGSDLLGPGKGSDRGTSGTGEKFDGIDDMVDHLLDAHFNTVANVFEHDIDIPKGYPFDRIEFGVQLYLIGYLKGELSSIFIAAADEWDDGDPEELDFSGLYRLIGDKVGARKDEISAAVNPHNKEKADSTEMASRL